MNTNTFGRASTARNGLILLAHGSRDPIWQRTAERLRQIVTETLGDASVALAYLQMSGPALPDAMGQLAEAGVTRVSVLPIFFSQGGHVAKDVPDAVADARHDHPTVEFEVLPPVGEDPRFFALVTQLSREALQ